MDVGRRCADGVLDVVTSYKEWQARSWLQAGSGLHRANVSGIRASLGNSQRARASLEHCREFCVLWDGLQAELSLTATACSYCCDNVTSRHG